jgi:hypothetical protein
MQVAGRSPAPFDVMQFRAQRTQGVFPKAPGGLQTEACQIPVFHAAEAQMHCVKVPPIWTVLNWRGPVADHGENQAKRPRPLCSSPGDRQAWVACSHLEPNSSPAGPPSLHLPFTPLPHPKPLVELPAGPWTAQERGGLLCPELALQCRNPALHRSVPGHLTDLTQTEPRNLLSPALLPQ